MGKFELAHGGTIFLDEIGELSMSMQAKLLRVLQDREFDRIGGTKSIKVDVRVIAATNRDLETMIEQSSFRRDLYYRLNIVPLFLLPLRERKDDIPALAANFLFRLSRDHDRKLSISRQAILLLKSYAWPGNVRELQNAVEYASISCNGDVIEPWHLPAYIRSAQKDKMITEDNIYDIKQAVANLERALIIAALANSNNNRTNAIKALNISRRAFYDKLRRYNISFSEKD